MAKAEKFHTDSEAVLLLNRGKRGFFRLIFGRTTVVVLLLAAQFLLLFWGFYQLRDYYVYGGSLLLSLIVALIVINRPQNPYIKITWILLIMLVPVLGIPLYFFVDKELGHRLARAQLAEIDRETAALLPAQPEAAEALKEADPGAAGVASYLQNTGGFPTWSNSGADYYPLGEDAFRAMLEALERAEDFIFLEYFIIDEGYMWGRILKLLEAKARQGVEVRVMYDGTCALYKLPYQYPKSWRPWASTAGCTRRCAPLSPPTTITATTGRSW